MQQTKKKPAALAVGERMEGPYTGRGNGARDEVNGTDAAEIRGIRPETHRRLNLIHGELAVAREERREDRREFREEVGKLDSRIARLESKLDDRSTGLDSKIDDRFGKLDSRIARLDSKLDDRSAGLDSKIDDRFTRLDSRITELDSKFEERFTRMETSIKELTAQVSTALERFSGTRRVILGVLGALGILLLGAAIRPLLDRAVSALLAG